MRTVGFFTAHAIAVHQRVMAVVANALSRAFVCDVVARDEVPIFAQTTGEAQAAVAALGLLRDMAPHLFRRLKRNVTAIYFLGPDDRFSPPTKTVLLAEGETEPLYLALALVQASTYAWLLSVGQVAIDTPQGERIHNELGYRAAVRMYERILSRQGEGEEVIDRKSRALARFLEKHGHPAPPRRQPE
ncbi:MAG: hypothetical protein IT380_24475 [Myxococcales bacterium]|nr:hypothetical protein [Myxococcales bacterium]